MVTQVTELDLTLSTEDAVALTSLVPSLVPDSQIVQADPRVNAFQLAKMRAAMRTSYTGAETINFEDLDKIAGVRTIEACGIMINDVPESINEETGVVQKAFTQVLFKLTDGRVVSCGGKMAVAFARSCIEDLGEMDWPDVAIIEIREKKGKDFPYPVFRIVG